MRQLSEGPRHRLPRPSFNFISSVSCLARTCIKMSACTAALVAAPVAFATQTAFKASKAQAPKAVTAVSNGVAKPSAMQVRRFLR